jgi:hypothetical protein
MALCPALVQARCDAQGAKRFFKRLLVDLQYGPPANAADYSLHRFE